MTAIRDTGLSVWQVDWAHVQRGERLLSEERAAGYHVLERLALPRTYQRDDLTTLVGLLHDEGIGSELPAVILPEPRWAGEPVCPVLLAHSLMMEWDARDEDLYAWSVRAWRSACSRYDRWQRVDRLWTFIGRGMRGR